MPRGVGITTNPENRRAHWASRFPKTFRDWQVAGACYSKSRAQARETELARGAVKIIPVAAAPRPPLGMRIILSTTADKSAGNFA